MAKKRFMDCLIWNKKNFRELEPKLKLAWFYLLTNCSHAGIYEVDIPLMSFKIGDDYTLDEVKKSFEKHIVDLGDSKWFLPAFIDFQYGLPLNPAVRVHQSVIKELDKYNIDIDKDSVINDKESVNIEDKLKNFADRVQAEVKDMNVPAKDLEDFISYWSEHNSGKNSKCRYEFQKIFNIKRRMTTWISNSKKFNSNMKFQPASDEDIAKKEARIEADYQEQQKRFRDAEKNVADENERRKALGLE